jgi:hypothetical protein
MGRKKKKKNLLKWLVGGTPNQLRQKQPPLRERVDQHDIEIADLWGAVNSLSTGVGSVVGRLDTLEARPGVPLPSGFERKQGLDGEEEIVFIGFPTLEPLEQPEEVSHDFETE